MKKGNHFPVSLINPSHMEGFGLCSHSLFQEKEQYELHQNGGLVCLDAFLDVLLRQAENQSQG